MAWETVIPYCDKGLLGTEWAEPGDGADAITLLAALEGAGSTGRSEAMRHLEAWIYAGTTGQTNLALTGRPIQDHDVWRIQVCGIS